MSDTPHRQTRLVFTVWYMRLGSGGPALLITLLLLVIGLTQPQAEGRFLSVFLGVPMAVIAYRGCRTATVIVDHEGVTVRTFARTRMLRWDTISGFHPEVGTVGANPFPRTFLVIDFRNGRHWSVREFNGWGRGTHAAHVRRVVSDLNGILATRGLQAP